MKKFTFLLSILIITLTNTLIIAQTNVSGIISSNVTWTVNGSPYIVTGNILVNTGVTLTIEPGVTIKFNALKGLQINGGLIAEGTSNNNITFTSNASVPDSGDWSYIYFSDSSMSALFDSQGNYIGGSILKYCTIEYAGSGTYSFGAVHISGSYPFINFCTIRNNSKTGIYANNLTDTLRIKSNTIYNNSRYCFDQDGGGGIYTSGGTVIIEGNTVKNNFSTYHGDGGGIYINSGKPIITNNLITNNSAAINGGAVYIIAGNGASITNNTIKDNIALMEFGGIYTLNTYAVISSNIIYNNGGGINYYYGSGTIANNEICNNTAPYAGGGLFIRSAAAAISNNIISDNAVTYTPYTNLGGGGICLGEYYYGMTVTITNNSIIRNKAKNSSAVDYSISYTGSDTESFSHNTILGNKSTNPDSTYTIRICYLPVFNFNNIFGNTAEYELDDGNANSTYLNAKNNWWGTLVDAQIQGKIYDWFDDPSLGFVTYNPYLTALDTIAPVSPPENVVKTDMGGGQIKLSWNHNPEQDIAGYHIYYGGFTGYSFTNMIDAGNDTTYVLQGNSLTETIGITAYDRTYNPLNENGSTIVNDNMTNGNESWFAFAVDTSALNGVVQTGNNIPKNFNLYQNYPNPFNPTTTISWQSPVGSWQSLKIYDILGREVATLVNEYNPAGKYEIEFNASSLPSGVYFYKLHTGNFVQTKKMILMK